VEGPPAARVAEQTHDAQAANAGGGRQGKGMSKSAKKGKGNSAGKAGKGGGKAGEGGRKWWRRSRAEQDR